MFTYPIDLFGKLFTFPITAKKYTKVQLENEEETTSIFNIVQSFFRAKNVKVVFWLLSLKIKNLAVMVVGKAQKEVVGMHSMQASKPKRLD